MPENAVAVDRSTNGWPLFAILAVATVHARALRVMTLSATGRRDVKRTFTLQPEDETDDAVGNRLNAPKCSRGDANAMYLETVDSAIPNPSLSSSPWMRGAPHNGFSLLSARSVRTILG